VCVCVFFLDAVNKAETKSEKQNDQTTVRNLLDISANQLRYKLVVEFQFSRMMKH
jgi:hypothetical protein